MIGKTLGHYRIVEKIGAGGMGEVYRARDVRLERDVAVKVLPVHLAEDPAALARFEREVKAIAALSHPNILGIFDVGSEGGIAYAVTELLEGETLRERLQEGALPVRRAVDCAIQVARGLAAAHDKGIVHRDLKPENIFLLKDGQVKILDFGLARQATPKDAEATASAALTSPGTVMGTSGYMSPEQVRGLEVDHRSDIFNFGLILHELLSGARAFHGETSVDTMQAILRADPPDLPEMVPGGLRRIVAHCLEKDPANRFQSARDLGFALAALAQSGSQAQAIPAPLKRFPWLRRALPTLGMVAIVVAAILITRWLSHTSPAPEWKGTLLGGSEIAWGPRISPDGTWLAFQTMVDGQSQVAVMKPGSSDYQILTDKSNPGLVMEICWAPDGNRIYYDRFCEVPLGIYSVPVTGGQEIPTYPSAIYPHILPDGSLLATHINEDGKYQMFQFWPSTNNMKEYPVEVQIGNMPYRVFPDGNEAIVSGTLIDPDRAEGQHLYVIELSTGRVRRLATPFSEQEEPRGALAVTRDTVLAVHSQGAFNRVVEIPRVGSAPVRTLLWLTKSVWFVDTAGMAAFTWIRRKVP
jgi:serine/threonine protein kinase